MFAVLCEFGKLYPEKPTKLVVHQTIATIESSTVRDIKELIMANKQELLRDVVDFMTA